jgi:gas vesicle protein
MKTASIHELKQQLNRVSPAQLAELCIRLAKYKKENKELLTYLLFEAHDLQAYIEAVKEEIDTAFATMSDANSYIVKKSLRKTLRMTNKHIKYTGSKQAEVELLIYFCTVLKNTGIPVHKSTALVNLWEQQLKKINKGIATMHEDLQYDYEKAVTQLSNGFPD